MHGDKKGFMQIIEGKSAAWNYTMGPAYIWMGTKSIDQVYGMTLPVVIVADYIPPEDLGKIQLSRVLGFAIERGKAGDPANVYYQSQHRATVIKAAGLLEHVKGGQTIVVDGVNGFVVVDPDEEMRAKYQDLRNQDLPPEPPGMAAEMLAIAQDFRKFSAENKAEELGELLPVTALKDAMDTILKMGEKLPLTPEDIAKLDGIIKDTPVEGHVLENVEKYMDAVAARPGADEGETADEGEASRDPRRRRRDLEV